LIFLLDMVLPQLDAYHAGRQLQHLQPWTSVVLAQRQEQGQPGLELVVRYGYEAFAGFHVVQLLTDGIPLLLFSDPKAVPSVSPWSLCVNGNLGSMEANVMAGRALFEPASLCHFLGSRKSNARHWSFCGFPCIPSNCPKVT